MANSLPTSLLVNWGIEHIKGESQLYLVEIRRVIFMPNNFEKFLQVSAYRNMGWAKEAARI